MPVFASLGRESVRAVAQYLIAGAETKLVSNDRSFAIDLKYTHDGYNDFWTLTVILLSASLGTLNTINLTRKKWFANSAWRTS